MKRTYCILCALFIILFSLCCGCIFISSDSQQYVCVAENVKSIQIIRLDADRQEAPDYDYTVLCEIPDTDTFVEQLNSLKHKTHGGAPRIPDIGYIAIRIEYHNGDYDAIHHRAQWFYRNGTTKTGYFTFDQAEYDALISTYLPQ